MKSFTNLRHKITPNVLKPIALDFQAICDPTNDLSKEIEISFGLNGNGIIFINNVPKYVEYRKDLLPLAKKIHDFTPEVKRKYTRPESYYLAGLCTYEKYQFKGARDMSTSWYFNSITDINEPFKYIKDGKEITDKFIDNFWPTEELPQLEPCLKNMGKLTYDVAYMLGVKIEKWVKSLVPKYEVGRINRIRPFGRLIHYQPSEEFHENNSEDAIFWHNDFSCLSIICSPLYLDQEGKEISSMIDEPDNGLEVLKRDGSINSCSIPSDCLAIQIGEIMQILSGGKLEATPHRVVATKYPKYTREQFANFLCPKLDEILSIPEGTTVQDVFDVQSDKVADLPARWTNGDSFKLYIDKTAVYHK